MPVSTNWTRIRCSFGSYRHLRNSTVRISTNNRYSAKLTIWLNVAWHLLSSDIILRPDTINLKIWQKNSKILEFHTTKSYNQPINYSLTLMMPWMKQISNNALIIWIKWFVNSKTAIKVSNWHIPRPLALQNHTVIIWYIKSVLQWMWTDISLNKWI